MMTVDSGLLFGPPCIFSWMVTTACCSVVGSVRVRVKVRIRFRVWLVNDYVNYLYYFPLSLWLSRVNVAGAVAASYVQVPKTRKLRLFVKRWWWSDRLCDSCCRWWSVEFADAIPHLLEHVSRHLMYYHPWRVHL